MGTRNLTVVQVDNEYKVAQYCQWDGYPSGQGVIILNFLKNVDIDFFADKVRKCRFLTEEEHNEKVEKVIPSIKGKGWITSEESAQKLRKFPELHRDTGPDVLQMIMDSDGLELDNSIDFVGDGLFCEWAYVIDLDKKQLEVYTGFSKKRKEGRFSQFNREDLEYAPVQLVKTYKLDKLPEEEDFIKELENDEED